MTDILVVDDEPDIRELVADILQDEGHGTRLAWDSETAFGEINRAAPDLIILDIWLKESRLDGIEILKKVRRDNPEIPSSSSPATATSRSRSRRSSRAPTTSSRSPSTSTS
jgi:two-component system, NtrC family, nitrogen regulation response regulator NtrX